MLTYLLTYLVGTYTHDGVGRYPRELLLSWKNAKV